MECRKLRYRKFYNEGFKRKPPKTAFETYLEITEQEKTFEKRRNDNG